MNFELLIVRTQPKPSETNISRRTHTSLLLVIKMKLWREATLDGNRWWREVPIALGLAGEPAFASWMGRTQYSSSMMFHLTHYVCN